MCASKASIVGEIGEYLAFEHLRGSGYELVGFGKGRRPPHGEHLRCSLPVVPDFWMGYSFGNFKKNALEGFRTEWHDSEIPHCFDFDYEQIKYFAAECKKQEKCQIKDGNPKAAPCAEIDKILDREWLTSITPHNPFGLMYDEKGKKVKLKGYQVVSKCLDSFTHILLRENRSSPPYGKDFLLVNMLVSEYIQGCWWKHSLNNGLPHSYKEIKDAKERFGDLAAEALKNENRAALKKFPGSGGHPGRYDFIVYKDGEISAFEVKVNTSKLDYWQTVRIALLQRFGCSANILRIKIASDQLDLAAKGIEPVVKEFSITSDINISNVHIPSDKEFVEVVNFAGDYKGEKFL